MTFSKFFFTQNAGYYKVSVKTEFINRPAAYANIEVRIWILLNGTS